MQLREVASSGRKSRLWMKTLAPAAENQGAEAIHFGLEQIVAARGSSSGELGKHRLDGGAMHIIGIRIQGRNYLRDSSA